jgi:hypothetical protein
MIAACGTWRFGLQVVGLVQSCRLCVHWAVEQCWPFISTY